MIVGLVSCFDRAWAAGFFEGEGSVSPAGGKGGRKHVLLSVTNTDRECLERFLAIVGYGAIYPRADDRIARGYKPCWQWNCWRQNEVDIVLLMLWPWLSTRRRDRAAELREIRDAYKASAMAERVCPTCGDTFRPASSNVARLKTYCSTRCRNNAPYKRERNNERRRRARGTV